MKKINFGIAPEGLPAIGFSFLCTLTFAALECEVLSILGLLLSGLILNFFRDPERVVPDEEETAVSPADGKVVAVDREKDPFSQEDRLRISVFMNIFNVHVNRAPVEGQVSRIRYIEGKFFNAFLDKASEDNERCLIQLKDSHHRFYTVVLIAGLIARRIVCRVKKGDDLEKGERLGMIKFGSRVDLYLPEEYETKVRVGQKVKAGYTILAKGS